MTFDLRLKEGDLSIKNGDLEIVTGKDKLIQDILKIAITPAGANPYALWYGSFIAKTLIGAYLADDIIVESSQSQLQLAISTLQRMQVQQVQEFRRLSSDEQIASILAITVDRNQVDPRLFSVSISVLNRAFKKVEASFNVSPF